MTNAERFIGDEDLIDTFIEEFVDYAETKDIDFQYHYLKEHLISFFKQQVKPTLTEDERVILKNVNEQIWEKIGRNEYGALCLFSWDNISDDCYINGIFGHLFRFIKERRRIFNSRIIERRIIMPTRNTTGENTTYTFTGHLVNEEIPTNEQKNEIHIHIEHIENLDLTLQM